MTIACSKFKLHHFYCAQPKWSVLLARTIVLTKKKNAALPLHEDLLRVGANVGSEMFSQVRSLAADRASPPVTKRQNNHLAPSCRLSLNMLKKLLRPAWPRSERGHHSAVRSLPMNFRDLSWTAECFPLTLVLS